MEPNETIKLEVCLTYPIALFFLTFRGWKPKNFNPETEAQTKQQHGNTSLDPIILDGNDDNNSQKDKDSVRRKRKCPRKDNSRPKFGVKKRMLDSDADGTSNTIIHPRKFQDILQEPDGSRKIQPSSKQPLEMIHFSPEIMERLFKQSAVQKATFEAPHVRNPCERNSTSDETPVSGNGSCGQCQQGQDEERNKANEAIKLPSRVVDAVKQHEDGVLVAGREFDESRPKVQTPLDSSRQSCDTSPKPNNTGESMKPRDEPADITIPIRQLEQCLGNMRELETVLAAVTQGQARAAEERKALQNALQGAQEKITLAEQDKKQARQEEAESNLRHSALLAIHRNQTVTLAEAEKKYRELDSVKSMLGAKEIELSASSDALAEAQAKASESGSQIEKLEKDRAGLEGQISELEGQKATLIEAAKMTAQREMHHLEQINATRKALEAQGLARSKLAEENRQLASEKEDLRQLVSVFESKEKAREAIVEKQAGEIAALQEKASRLVAVEAKLEVSILKRSSLWQRLFHLFLILSSLFTVADSVCTGSQSTNRAGKWAYGEMPFYASG